MTMIDQQDLEALALEISAAERVDLSEAMRRAVAQWSGLTRYAREWDDWIAAWHDSRSVITTAG